MGVTDGPAYTPAAYVAAGGGLCPACGDPSISGDEINVDGVNATQEVGCSECGASWLDTYELTGYDRLERGDGD